MNTIIETITGKKICSSTKLIMKIKDNRVEMFEYLKKQFREYYNNDK
jgi:hypothetical protein